MKPTDDLITTISLSAARHETVLTAPISFTLHKGAFIQLRGPNGSGKSTYLRQFAGLVPSLEGRLLVRGEACQPDEIAHRLHIGYVGHRDEFHGDLTGYENFEILSGKPRDELVQKALYERPVASYSAGQRQLLRLHILSDDCDIWLLDEPSASLDDTNLLYLEERIAGFLAQGGAIIASTHLPLAQSRLTQAIEITPYEAGAS